MVEINLFLYIKLNFIKYKFKHVLLSETEEPGRL